MYDICCRKSFENVPNWMDEAKTHIEPHRAVFILVGCKLDLKDQREVTTEEAKRFADANEMPFVETSAKTGTYIYLKWIYYLVHLYISWLYIFK